MQEFYNRIIEMENITTYLAVAIAVLVILFFLVLFLGKKDQKLEETKKLKRIEMDGFKETSAAVKAEVANNPEVVKEKIGIKNDDKKVESNSEDLPVISEIPEESTLAALQDLTDGNVELPKIKEQAKKEVVEIPAISEIKQDESEEPISISEIAKPIQKIEEEEIELPKINKEELVIEQEEAIELPEFNFDEVLNSLNEDETVILEEPSLQLPKEEPLIVEKEEPLVINEPIKDETPVAEPVRKTSMGQQIFSSVYVPKKPEDDIIDLTGDSEPKKEKSVEKVESNPSFNSILGESYNIKE